MRYLICERVEQQHSFRYYGMDRYGIGLENCPNRDLSKKAEFVEIAETEDENYVLEIYKEFLVKGYTYFDLLAIDKINTQTAWTFLGYDIGEKNNDESKWSAIYKYDHYTNYRNMSFWADKLNPNGLFDKEQEASKFRQFYLNSEDPVLKEAPQNESCDLYQVARVYLCTKFDSIICKSLLTI